MNLDSAWVAILLGMLAQTLLMGRWTGGITASVSTVAKDLLEFKTEVRADITGMREDVGGLKEDVAELKGRFDTFERRRDR